MWLKFPKGITQISVEQDTYEPEHTDADGVNYFRIPDRFAQRVLDTGMGFEVVKDASKLPDDLPQPDPVRDTTIAELTARLAKSERDLAAARKEIGNLTDRLVEAGGRK